MDRGNLRLEDISRATASAGRQEESRAGMSAPCSLQEVSILMADIRGFTAMAEDYSPVVMLETLNRYLAKMCEIAVSHGGTVDKFMGDAVMLLFGAPRVADDDARRAVDCAVAMQIAVEEMNRENAMLGLPPLHVGIGINTGQVIAGRLGSELHSEYTVVGNEVNIAARIEAFSLRGQVLISETTFERCAGHVETAEPVEVQMKGKSAPVRLREVLAIPSLGWKLPRQDVRRSPRVEVHIPCVYQNVEDKVIIPGERRGIVHDMSYDGMLTEVDSDLAEHDDIVVRLDLSLVGSQVRDIYAKVRSVRDVREQRLAGVEFTAIQQELERDLRRFVQLLLQGSAQK